MIENIFGPIKEVCDKYNIDVLVVGYFAKTILFNLENHKHIEIIISADTRKLYKDFIESGLLINNEIENNSNIYKIQSGDIEVTFMYVPDVFSFVVDSQFFDDYAYYNVRTKTIGIFQNKYYESYNI